MQPWSLTMRVTSHIVTILHKYKQLLSKIWVASIHFHIETVQVYWGQSTDEGLFIISRLAANWKTNKRQSNWSMNGRGCINHPIGKSKNKIDRMVVVRKRTKKAKGWKKKKANCKRKKLKTRSETSDLFELVMWRWMKANPGDFNHLQSM